MLALLLLSASGVEAIDVMERPAAVVLSPPADGFAVAPTGYAYTAYRDNAVLNTDIDQFQVEAFAHHALVDMKRFRASVFYGTFMFNGPVTAGDEPGAEAAQWMMNAIQYEYGFVFSYALPLRRYVDLTLLAEYSRRSYHPLRSGFEEPAADLLRAGVALRTGRLLGHPGLSGDAMARLSWSELYDFWGASQIPAPRARYTLHVAGEARYRPGRAPLELFGLVMPDLVFLRDGGADVDLAVQSGVAVGSRWGTIELYLDYYRSTDTEQLPEQRSPATLLGYGLRFVLSPRESPGR